MMKPIAQVIDVITFAPSVQMSLSIALSIDYSLFMLGRYREELKQGLSNVDATVAMIRTAGHVYGLKHDAGHMLHGEHIFSSVLQRR